MDRVMPIDLEHPNLRKRFRGYDVRTVDALLRGAARSLHELKMENEALRERLVSQTDELERARDKERLVHDVLSTAQRAADETRVAAQKHAEALVEEARLAALSERIAGQQQVSDVRVELEQLRADRARLEADIRATLERYLRELTPTAPRLTVVDGEGSATANIVAGATLA